MGQQIFEILRNNRLSMTTGRIKIAELFLNSARALTYNEIESIFHTQLDRATIYRTLTTFIEKGIIHSIPTADHSVVYALCKNECTENHHHDEHIHFVCDTCGQTTCLEKVIIPQVKLPEGYTATEFKMIVTGKCGTCVSN